MVTSPIELTILEWEENPQTSNKKYYPTPYLEIHVATALSDIFKPYV